MHKHKIEAVLNEGIDAEGVGFPESVTVTGAGFLAPSAISAIAQTVVDSYVGQEFGDYAAVMPDWGMRSDTMQIKVIKRRF